MVRNAAGRTQGSPQQAPLTPQQARLLLSEQGRLAVAEAALLDLAPHARLRAAEHMRRFGPELGPLALDQAVLRQRATAKHPRGAQMWWTGEALEQASPHEVARWRAERFAEPVIDLCCSVGGDLLALPPSSVGVDLDLARLMLARANADALGHVAAVVQADATRFPLPSGAHVFVDPARRVSGRRVFDPRAYTPPLDTVLAWREHVRSLVVKVAPGVDYDVLPDDVEVDVVSLHGDVKEATLSAGEARSGSRRRAVLLPQRHTLVARGLGSPPVRSPGRFLLEPDGAVVRAHLVAELADDLGGWLLDPTIAYVTADQPTPTPFGTWYELLDVMPFALKRLRAWLVAHDVGNVVVKKRGTAVEPDELRRRLRLRGTQELVVVLTRVAGNQVAMPARRLAPPGG